MEFRVRFPKSVHQWIQLNFQWIQLDFTSGFVPKTPKSYDYTKLRVFPESTKSYGYTGLALL